MTLAGEHISFCNFGICERFAVVHFNLSGKQLCTASTAGRNHAGIRRVITGIKGRFEKDGFKMLMLMDNAGFRDVVNTKKPVRVPADLKLTLTNEGGGNVPLQPVMGAFAHLVAFDADRSGFAHLHPMEVDLLAPPDAVHPQLNFKVTIPESGRYVIWAQVNLGGTEVFRPFPIEVGR